MKFAQEFRKALQQEEFPQKWVECAIPYGQLKKCLKKVTKELKEIGLDSETLRHLADDQHEHPSDHHAHHDKGFCYNLDVEGKAKKCTLRPRLTVFIHMQNGVAIDATLSPHTREFLQKLALSNAAMDGSSPSERDLPVPSKASFVSHDSDHSMDDVRRVEVPLVFDAEFFDILQSDVTKIGSLQEEEQAKLESQIVTLGQGLGKAVEPSRGWRAKADMEVWRQIFELYLSACVFFSTRESDHGARTSIKAVEQLHWFQDQVVQRKLVKKLKLGTSQTTFKNFVNINTSLLSILKYQEINRMAISKILKKFDKRTFLGVSTTFPSAVRAGDSLIGSVARDVCARMSTELIAVVPQLDDYLCPICFVVAYWPVRLNCDHVFCSRCLVKMSREGKKLCPLCRADNVMMADINSVDAERAAFLRKYFPKEVKEKIRANERERNKEIFGPGYNNMRCSVM